MKAINTIIVAFLIFASSCASVNKQKKKEKDSLVLIETVYGNMKVRLYNETPLHRDNFLKLVNEKFYDSLLFHRVINEFMIQGGDPNSKNAPEGKMLGDGDVGYSIDAEFSPHLFHKKGALAAAREGDQVNPQKKSSGCQFYIVQGRKFTAEEIKKMEERINFPKRKKLVFDYIEKPENQAIKQELEDLQRIGDFNTINDRYDEIAKTLESEYQKLELFSYTPEQFETYTSIGGTPHLDQNYTVFGEVIEGLNVIDSIAKVRTDVNNRPLDNIVMKIKRVKK